MSSNLRLAGTDPQMFDKAGNPLSDMEVAEIKKQEKKRFRVDLTVDEIGALLLCVDDSHTEKTQRFLLVLQDAERRLERARQRSPLKDSANFRPVP